MLAKTREKARLSFLLQTDNVAVMYAWQASILAGPAAIYVHASQIE
jgi:hypothetical protein